jgi:hypothetical protein
MAFAILASSITVNWNPIGTTNTVRGYKIYYGPSSHNYTNFVTTGYVTNTVISNLPPNTLLFFAGTTIGDYGLETTFGNEISKTTNLITNGLPSMVKDFTLVTH